MTCQEARREEAVKAAGNARRRYDGLNPSSTPDCRLWRVSFYIAGLTNSVNSVILRSHHALGASAMASAALDLESECTGLRMRQSREASRWPGQQSQHGPEVEYWLRVRLNCHRHGHSEMN